MDGVTCPYETASLATTSPHRSELNRIKSGTCAIWSRFPNWVHAIRGVCGLRVRMQRGRRFGSAGGGVRRAFQGLRLALIPPRSGQVRPVACLIRPDLAPRDALRSIGPRPGRTRSASVDEPGRTAIRSGNRERGFLRTSASAASPPCHREKRPSSHDWTAVSLSPPAHPSIRPAVQGTPSHSCPATPAACPAARWSCCSRGHRR